VRTNLAGAARRGVFAHHRLDIGEAGELGDIGGPLGERLIGLAGAAAEIGLLAADLDQLGADRALLAQPRELGLLRGRVALLVSLGKELGPLGAELAGLGLGQREQAIDLPVFIGNEVADLALALDDQTHGD